MNTRLLAMTGVTFGVLFTLAFHSLQQENAALESEIETITGSTVVENELYDELKEKEESKETITTNISDASVQPIEEEKDDNAKVSKKSSPIEEEKDDNAKNKTLNNPKVNIQRTSFEKPVQKLVQKTTEKTVEKNPVKTVQQPVNNVSQKSISKKIEIKNDEPEIIKLQAQAKENREKLLAEQSKKQAKVQSNVSISTPRIPVDHIETNDSHEKLLFPSNPIREIFPVTFEGDEVFVLDNGVDNLITGKDGTLIALPSGSFVDEAGIVVEGKVQFHLKEFYKKSQLLISDINTKTFNGALHANGMIFAEATQQSRKLNWNPGKQMLISFTGHSGAETQLIHKTDAQNNWSVYHNEEKNLISLPLHTLKFGQEIDAKYERTIIATREFEKRYNFLKAHAKESKSQIISLYISNLNLPMHEIDEMAAQKLKESGANYGVIQQFKSYSKENWGHVINTQDTDLKLDAEQTRLYEALQQGILNWRKSHPFTPVAVHTFKFNQLGFIGNTSEKSVSGNSKVQIVIENDFAQTPYVQVVLERKNTVIPAHKTGVNQYLINSLPESEEAWIISIVKEKNQTWFSKTKFTTGKERLVKVQMQPIDEASLEKLLSVL